VCWPTELVACPFEMGEWVHYPEMSLENDFRVPDPHPLLVADLATLGGKRNGFMALGSFGCPLRDPTCSRLFQHV